MSRKFNKNNKIESIIKKFEKDKVNMSQIYGGSTQYCTGRMLWGSRTDMTMSGTEYADFNDQGCCIISFMSDTGVLYHLEPIC